MTSIPPPRDILSILHKAERELLRRHGLRLQVDRVSLNGRNALCTAKQVERKFLRSTLRTEEIADVCHEALTALHSIGLNPLIDIHLNAGAKEIPKVDPQDPFRLRLALCETGLEAMLAPDFAIPKRLDTAGVITLQP